MLFTIICVSKYLVSQTFPFMRHIYIHTILSSPSALFLTYVVPPGSSYWSHAGLHSTGREESGFAAQLPPRFPQVRFNSQHTTRDFMSCLADSQMSRYIHIRISAARLAADPQNMSHEIDFLLWKVFLLRLTIHSTTFYDRYFASNVWVLWVECIFKMVLQMIHV